MQLDIHVIPQIGDEKPKLMHMRNSNIPILGDENLSEGKWFDPQFSLGNFFVMKIISEVNDHSLGSIFLAWKLSLEKMD